MGTTKTAEYSIKELSIAKYAKALSHPARIAILNLLLKNCNFFGFLHVQPKNTLK